MTMKLLLLIIPFLIGCSTEVVADVDELYREYTCEVGYLLVGDFYQNTDKADYYLDRYPDIPFEYKYIGDASYTKGIAEEECRIAYNAALAVAIDRYLEENEKEVIGRIPNMVCQCEKGEA